MAHCHIYSLPYRNPSSADHPSTLDMAAQVTKAGGSIVTMQDVLGTARQ